MKFKINAFLVATLGLICLGFHVVDATGPTSSRLRPGKAARNGQTREGLAQATSPAFGDEGEGAGDCCPPAAPDAVQRGVVAPYVEVRASEGLGSGTAIRLGDEVLVLTAAHVVGGWDRSVSIRRPTDGNGQYTQDAEVVFKSSPDEYGGQDLALLRPEDPGALSPVDVDLDPLVLRVGEDAWYCGSGGGVPANLDRTIINRMGLGDGKWVLVNGNGWYGHSGSGVFVRRGGRFVLAGVVLRIVRGYPKSPVLCRCPEAVVQFLKDYLEDQR